MQYFRYDVHADAFSYDSTLRRIPYRCRSADALLHLLPNEPVIDRASQFS